MKTSKEHRKSKDLQLIEGTNRHLEKGWSLIVAGTKYTQSQIIELLQSRVDAVQAAAAARAAWSGARAHDEELSGRTAEVVQAVRQTLLVMFRRSPEVLADFGLAPPKARRALTSAERVVKAARAKATREARHTLGKRQRLAIHGTVPAEALSAPTLPAAVPAVHAAASATDGVMSEGEGGAAIGRAASESVRRHTIPAG
jgi:hypothetical protein